MSTLKEIGKDIVVGLDIGTTKILVVVAQKHENEKIEILGSGEVESKGVIEGEVQNIMQTSEDIKKAVKLAEESTGYKIREVVVGIAGAHIKSKKTRFVHTRSKESIDSLIDKSDIYKLQIQVNDLIMLPGEIIISHYPEEFYVDGKVPLLNNPIGMRGNRLEAEWHLMTGNESSSKNIQMSLDLAELSAKRIDLEPLASSRAVLTEDQMQDGVCLVDIGGGTTDIAIFCDGMIRHTAILPLAGEHITEAIKNNFNLNTKTAKFIKENSEITSALYKHINKFSTFGIKNEAGVTKEIGIRAYCTLINKCVEQIFKEVNNAIKASAYRDKLNAGIVITGGGAMIPNLNVFVEQFMGYNTKIGHPIIHLKNLQDKKFSNTKYATGLGLALIAMEDKEDQLTKQSASKQTIETHKTEIPTASPKNNKQDSWIKRIQVPITNSLKNMLIDENEFKDFEN